MFVEERFLSDVLNKYGKHQVSSGDGTWYPHQACKFLNLHHPLNSSFEKSIVIERTMQYIKDRTKSFDDYFHCKMKKYRLKHVINWLNMFVDYHNMKINLK